MLSSASRTTPTLCHQHPNISQIQGPLEMELLAAESHALLHAIEPTLRHLLELTQPTSAPISLLRAVPILNLRFNSPERHDATDAGHPGILNAFALLAHQSRCLNAFPELKTAFWTDVMQSEMVFGDVRTAHKSQFREASSPDFVIDFSIRGFNQRCKVNKALGEALFVFMKFPVALPARQTRAEGSMRTKPVAFGLSFTNSNLLTPPLEIIERFLDRAFALSAPQYAIKSLSFSDNVMNLSELMVVSRIVEKTSAGVYQVEELFLNGILPNISMMQYRPFEETPVEVHDIVRAAFGVNNLPRLASAAPTRLTGCETRRMPAACCGRQPASMLRKISLSENAVSPEYFAALFSTLRYGCPLEEDTSSYAMMGQQQSVECWRWLAFGLFCPRPERFASKFKLRTIGKLKLSPMVIRTITNTLRNPTAELVYGGSNRRNSPVTADVLMVCTVTKGASIAIFEIGKPTGSSASKTMWLVTLAETSELEALCEQKNGSVCVVVPGVGLGWVQSEFVERIEREPGESCRSKQDSWFDVTFGGTATEIHVDDLLLLLSAIGRQFRSLTFDFTHSIRGVFGEFRLKYPDIPGRTVAQMITDHCVNLKQLNFNSASAVEISGALDALSSELGQRLLVLNLNGSGDIFDDVCAVRLATMLAKMEDTPVLQEVRLADCWFRVQGLRSLHDALRVNRTLTLLELAGNEATFTPEDTDLREEQKHLEAAFQGQLVQKAVPMPTKLAFLSIILLENKPGKALGALDLSVLSLVFEFAAGRKSFKTAAFPCFVVDFSHDACQIPVDDVLGESLHTFMMTPATTQAGQVQVAPSTRIALGLSFAKCNLTNNSLECIERFLDRTFANPDRMYDLKMLSLSDNAMAHVALAVVARIVQKSKCMYNIGEFKLEVINVRGAPKTPKEFLDIARAAYDIKRLPRAITGDHHHTYRSTSPDKKRSRLRNLALGSNSLSPSAVTV